VGRLRSNLKELFGKLEKVAKVSLEEYFIREDEQRADWWQKIDIAIRTLLFKDIGPANFTFFPEWISERIKSSLEFKPSGVFEFKSETEANEFAEQSVVYAKQKAESLLANFREKTEEEIGQARTNLIDFLKKQTQPIIERAQTRLKEAFNVDLSLPPPSLKVDAMDSVEFTAKQDTRVIDGGFYEVTKRKRVWWHWLWIVPIEVTEEKKRPDKTEDYYIVSLKELIQQINQSVATCLGNMEKEINQYLEEDLQGRVDAFFKGLDSYLRNYQDSLIQAQFDQALDLKNKEKLVAQLESLVPEVEAQIEKTEISIQRTDIWMSAKDEFP